MRVETEFRLSKKRRNKIEIFDSIPSFFTYYMLRLNLFSVFVTGEYVLDTFTWIQNTAD